MNQLEKVSRVRAMVQRNSKWDLSPNDIEAIRFVLEGFPNPRLVEALQAVLLFYDPSPWTSERQLKWGQMTEHADATTKGLCDFIRNRLNVPYADYVERHIKESPDASK